MMANYRDPKVTNTHQKKDSGMGKWIGIAVVAIVVLILLAWLMGWFNDDDEAGIIEEPATVQEPVDEPGETAPVIVE